MKIIIPLRRCISMTTVIPFMLLLMGWGALWLLYLNRSSSKMHEATIVLAITILGALAIILKGEPIEKRIHVVYFANIKENAPAFFDVPILEFYQRNQNMIYNMYKDEMEKQKKEFSFDFKDSHQSFVDLQLMTIVNHLFLYYSRDWFVERLTKKFPGFIGTTGKQIRTDKRKGDIIIYEATALPAIKQAPFYSAKLGFQAIALPKGTKINYIRNQKSQLCELQLSKPLHFVIRIKIRFQSGILGLGEVGHYVGLTSFKDKYVNPAVVGDYQTVVLEIDCEAKFGRLMQWNPDVIRYKEWAQKLFDDLYETFDWTSVNREMSTHQRDIATEMIIGREVRHVPPEGKRPEKGAQIKANESDLR